MNPWTFVGLATVLREGAYDIKYYALIAGAGDFLSEVTFAFPQSGFAISHLRHDYVSYDIRTHSRPKEASCSSFCCLCYIKMSSSCIAVQVFKDLSMSV